jgi:hypothetical protein
MKTKYARKLTLHRESLRRLEDVETRNVAGAAPVTGLCAYTLQLACYSQQIPSCGCTVQ